MTINFYELDGVDEYHNRNRQTSKKFVKQSTIHLLSPTAFDNPTPNFVVNKHLKKKYEDVDFKLALDYKVVNTSLQYYIEKKLNNDLLEIEDFERERLGLEKSKMNRTMIVNNKKSAVKSKEVLKTTTVETDN